MSVLVWFMLANASAQALPSEPEPTEERLAEAKRLYAVGSEWYEEGQYERAIDAFRRAFDLTQSPAILFNIANAQERGGFLEDALVSLEQYRLVAPAEEMPALRRRILSIEERLVSQRDTEDWKIDVGPATEDGALPEPIPAVRRRPRWAWVWGGVTTSVVLSSVAVGSYAASRTAIRNGNEQAYGTSRTVNNVSLAAAGGGVVFAALGLVLQQPVDDGLRVSVAPNGAMLRVRF